MGDPVVAKKGPFAVEVEEGKHYWWCACGRSKDQPWCDGSHLGTGLEPLQYVAEKTGRVFLCGCKHTKTPPMCDGAHQTLQDDQ